jgi:hypothetical protein
MALIASKQSSPCFIITKLWVFYWQIVYAIHVRGKTPTLMPHVSGCLLIRIKWIVIQAVTILIIAKLPWTTFGIVICKP